MPTIKEIACLAGVSASTVSIVLNGKSEDRKIPPHTQEKVREAAQKLGYHANVSARRLRSQPGGSLVISVFWASDFRAPMMVRFLRGLQEAVLSCGKKCEIVIHPYDNNKLKDHIMTLQLCNAAIICNASAEDMSFLESYTPPVPIVLYNRHSDKFCTVNVNDVLLGEIPARIFAGRNHRNAAVLKSNPVFAGMDLRVDGFRRLAERSGLTVRQVLQENSMAGGYLGGKSIFRMSPLPDCLFCVSDAMAVGAVRAFYQAKVAVPGKIEIISIGNGDRELEEYSAVSLSVVYLPMEKMAAACLKLVFSLLDGTVKPPFCVELPIAYRERESCGNVSPEPEK